jgi:hypothetical protein
MSSDASNCVLSLASPPVRWKSRGLPSRSVLRWILVEEPPPERTNAWRGFLFLPRRHETCARAVEELDQVRRLAAFRQHLEDCLEYPGTAEPPEPLPYAVSFAISAGESGPRHAVYSEVVGNLEEFTAIMPRLSPARLRPTIRF